MADRKRMGLARKFNLLTISIILVTSLGIALFMARQEIRSSNEELLRHGKDVSFMVSLNSEYAIYTEDKEALLRVVETLTADDIAYVSLLNKEGHTLAEKAARAPARPPVLPINVEDPAESRHEKYVSRADGKSYIEIVTPVISRVSDFADELFMDGWKNGKRAEIIGYVQLGLTLEGVHKRIRSFLKYTAFLTASIIVLAIAVTFALTRKITSPIRSFVHLTQQIADGHINQTIETRTNDEISDLAHAFNIMLQRLRTYREQVEEQQHTLEEKVIQRTLELQHATKEAQELAQKATEASRAKSQFLANMSHEIRTPMNGVLGMAEILLGTALSEKQRHLVATLSHSAGALLGILNDILDFSKIEAGRLELKRTDFDLHRCVGKTVELLVELAHEKGLELACHIDEEVPAEVEGDPVRLQQILTNLLGNAIKFTESGKIAVEVRVLEDAGDSVLLAFEVSDSGMGIDLEAQERIFDAFSQADGSTTRKHGGTGLGLSICKQLCEMMGGEISVRSNPGEGSTFTFTARLARRSPPFEHKPITRTEAIKMPPDCAPTDERVSFKGRILLAEDNEVNQLVACFMLEDLGCDVEVVENGREAIDALSRKEYELILMDCQMPGMDGYEATKIIRDSNLAHTPIIALTAHAMGGDREKCLAAGMDDYLSKPFTQEQLSSVLIRWLPFTEKPSENGDGVESEDGQSVLSVSEEAKQAQSIDISALDNIRALQEDGGPDILERIIRSYLNKTPKLLNALREALEQSDAATIRNTAHSMKSSSANVGANILAGLCRELEAMGRDNQIAGAGTLVARIEAEYARVESALIPELQRRD